MSIASPLALIFDVDDTLFDHALAMEAFLRGEFGLDSEVDALLAFDARGAAPRGEFCDRVGAIVGIEGEEVWRLIQERLGLHVTAIAPGIIELADQHFRVGLLTNGSSQNQRTKIEALGLDAIIAPAAIIISGEVGARKPNPRAFEFALLAVGCDPQDTVYVGDNPRVDIAGAHAVGIRTCWVARGRTFPDTPGPDWTIESIADLPQIWDQFPT